MKKFIGDKAFYKMVLGVAGPIILQNGFTQSVNLINNIMVGRMGTEQMSGVAIANQLLMIYTMGIFGAISAAGLFGTQFFGCKDYASVRHIFRFKIYICLIITILAVGVFSLWGEELIMMYLHDDGTGASLEATLAYGKQYLMVMLFSLVPYGVEQIYSSTLRECGKSAVPMKASIIAVLMNCILSFVLIFGYFGFPKLGVIGAAVATCLSRCVQAAMVVGWMHRHTAEMPFMKGAYASLRIPISMVGRITVKGVPLVINEILWSTGMAMLMQCYSVRGLEAVAAMNISSTVFNLFKVVFVAMSTAMGIVVGQLMGAGKMEEAKEVNSKMMVTSVFFCVVIGGLLILIAPMISNVYSTSAEVKNLATALIRVIGVVMPIQGYANASYYTIRSGGNTFIAFLIDGAFVWSINFPIAYILSRYTDINIILLYFICLSADIIKCIIGFVLIKKGIWLHRLVAKEKDD